MKKEIYVDDAGIRCELLVKLESSFFDPTQPARNASTLCNSRARRLWLFREANGRLQLGRKRKVQDETRTSLN